MSERTDACPKCGSLEGRILGQMSTLMAGGDFRDADGMFHNHDPNFVTADMQCVCGNRYAYELKNKCWCGWKSKTRTERRQEMA